jgi:hypothetical protein
MKENEAFAFLSEEIKKDRLITPGNESDSSLWKKYGLHIYKKDLNKKELKHLAKTLASSASYLSCIPGVFKGTKRIPVKSVKEALADYEKNVGIAPDIAIEEAGRKDWRDAGTKEFVEGIGQNTADERDRKTVPDWRKGYCGLDRSEKPYDHIVLCHSSAFRIKIKEHENGLLFEMQQDKTSYDLIFSFVFDIRDKKYFRFYSLDKGC